MLLKERNDFFVQMLQPSHPKSHPILVVCTNHAALKKCFECVEELDVSFVLNYGKFWKHLELAGHIRVGINADEETTFAIHESDHPMSI